MAVLDLKQKARVKLVIEGDENTKFFHGFISNNKRNNHITRIMINDTWSIEVNEIKRSF